MNIPPAGTAPVVAIEGIPRDYDWGSTSAIENMLGLPRDGNPIAELWFGAHPNDPAPIPALGVTLEAFIAEDPKGRLGELTAIEFDSQLPFLLKVLAAERPLSIQVHPTREQAIAGFAVEDEAGVARDTMTRNYRDPNHKPELICALTEFEALCGFRGVADIETVLARFALPELDFVTEALQEPDPLRAAFKALLTVEDVAPIARAVAARAAALLAEDSADRGLGDRELGDRELGDRELSGGAARAVVLAAEHYPEDVGLVLSLLLNYVVLKAGEAIFLAAGNVHAYLKGVGVEIMAASDNVLRSGLTTKHIDVDELLKVADFTPLDEPRWEPLTGGGYRDFTVPVPDFQLLRVPLEEFKGSCVVNVGPWVPCIVLCTEGEVTVSVGVEPESPVTLGPGRAAFVSARRDGFRIEGRGVAFVAGRGQIS
ncbi:MAG TPA: mannose-6-phosphate isomerase, class I [Jatrophihabitans sp.]